MIEEIEMAVASFSPIAEFIQLQRENSNAKYDDLKLEEKRVVRKFYAAREAGDSFTLKMNGNEIFRRKPL